MSTVEQYYNNHIKPKGTPQLWHVVADAIMKTALPDEEKRDGLILVISGRIAKSWEESNGPTTEKTKLVKHKQMLTNL